MLTLGQLLLALLMSTSLGQTTRIPGPGGATPAAGGAQTFVQSIPGVCVAATGVCTFTFLTPTTSTNLLEVGVVYGNAVPVVMDSLTGGGTFSYDSGTGACAASTDCVGQGQILSATGGITVYTLTMHTGTTYLVGRLAEYHKTSGTWALDGTPGSTTPAACTSCATPTAMVTGTDVVVRMFNTSGTASNPGAPFTNPGAITTEGMFAAINQTSGTGPSVAQTPSGPPVTSWASAK